MTPQVVPPLRRPHLIIGVGIIVVAVLLVAALIGGDYLLTLYTAHHAIEQAQSASLKGALRECTALQGLAEIKGSHNASATYGYHLQTGIANVYNKSGCPELLAKYGPRR